jgi:hypothetical protein
MLSSIAPASAKIFPLPKDGHNCHGEDTYRPIRAIHIALIFSPLIQSESAAPALAQRFYVRRLTLVSIETHKVTVALQSNRKNARFVGLTSVQTLAS